MYEKTNRIRPRLKDVRSEKRENEREGFFLTGFQSVICLLCLITAFLIKLYGGQCYKTAKAFAQNACQSSISSKMFDGVLQSISRSFPDASEVFKNQASSSASKIKTSSAVNSSSSKTTSSEPEKAKTSSAAAQISSASGLKTGSLVYESSEDLPLQTSNVTTGSPAVTKTVSMSPYKLSIKPVLPVKGNISSKFGERINPITKVESFHTGIDIAAAEGTPIAAAYAGTVEQVGSSGAYGNYALISDGGGIETFYGHCEVINVKQGDKIQAGDVIAKVGSTGMSTGPHLHFEIRINGIYVNPQFCLYK